MAYTNDANILLYYRHGLGPPLMQRCETEKCILIHVWWVFSIQCLGGHITWSTKLALAYLKLFWLRLKYMVWKERQSHQSYQEYKLHVHISVQRLELFSSGVQNCY